jgi:hypothetical protein
LLFHVIQHSNNNSLANRDESNKSSVGRPLDANRMKASKLLSLIVVPLAFLITLNKENPVSHTTLPFIYTTLINIFHLCCHQILRVSTPLTNENV